MLEPKTLWAYGGRWSARTVLKVEGKLAGADGRDEILQEGAKKGEGDTINSDGDETDDDEQQRHNNNNSSSSNS